MHTSQRDRIRVAILCATVWSSCVIAGESLRLHSERMSRFMKQEPAFNRDCKAFPNKRIIMVTANEEYWYMLLNWFYHAKVYMGENDQLVVVAQDEGIVEKLQKSSFVFMDLNNHLNIPTNSTIGTSGIETKATFQEGVVSYDSLVFNHLTGKRPAQILHFLKLNCTVLYSDVDTVWLGDVFQDIAKAGAHDLYITDDSREDDRFPRQWYLCTCFLYLQPSPSVREFVQNWANAVSDKTNDQPPFNQVLESDLSTRHLVDFTVLPYGAFPPGISAKHFWGTPGMRVLHANWHTGLEEKTKFLLRHGHWKVL